MSNMSETVRVTPAKTSKSIEQPSCRLCGSSLGEPFLDLGQQPLCESILRKDQLNQMEPFFPLQVYLCDECMLVQLDQYVSPDHIFTEYAYFSSYSDSWLKHSKAYARMATDRFGLGPNSLAIELASNDGYLLQYFSEHGVPVLGIEPAANVAKAASEKGVPTLVKFLGVRTAEEQLANGTAADLLIGNNVLAQAPDLHDFVEGMRIILKLHGRITMELLWTALVFFVTSKIEVMLSSSLDAPVNFNTLLSLCRMSTVFVYYVADIKPYKSSRILLDSHNTFFLAARLKETRPDLFLIL